MTDDQKQIPVNVGDRQQTSGQRVLHTLLPEAVFNHVKAQAALSGMAFRLYLEQYLSEASPYPAKPCNGNTAKPTSGSA